LLSSCLNFPYSAAAPWCLLCAPALPCWGVRRLCETQGRPVDAEEYHPLQEKRRMGLFWSNRNDKHPSPIYRHSHCCCTGSMCIQYAHTHARTHTHTHTHTHACTHTRTHIHTHAE
jgi:hypothetical protein